jgi:hypothetical protein
MKNTNKNDLYDSAAFYLADNPGCSIEAVIKFIDDVHGEKISTQDVNYVKSEYQKLIREYRMGGSTTVNKAITLGTLSYATIYQRLKILNEIVKETREGYTEEKLGKDGEIYYITTKSYQSTLQALAQIGQVMATMPNGEEEYETLIGELDPITKKILSISNRV